MFEVRYWNSSSFSSNGLANHISSRFPDSPLLRINKSLVKEGRKLRYPKGQRVRMFRTIIEAIRKRGTNVHIALCKEQPQIWKAVGLAVKGLSCNCLIRMVLKAD